MKAPTSKRQPNVATRMVRLGRRHGASPHRHVSLTFWAQREGLSGSWLAEVDTDDENLGRGWGSTPNEAIDALVDDLGDLQQRMRFREGLELTSEEDQA